MTEIKKAKREIGKYWQYEENKKELKELLERVRELRIKIAKFEEEK
ncbi:MAG: hypothetical protein ACOCP8_01045 [archaeon]